jgi:dTDP-4-amino-4,6-dideoxygalactose transaminase
MTFCATANVVLHAGARPVLVDVDAATQCVDPDAVEAAITPRTRAIIPVHFAGHPAPMAALRRIANRHVLAIVQDAAHCIEGRIDGGSLVAYGDVLCLSFYATKNVVTGEGGMAVTDDEALAARMRVLGLHGIDEDAWKRFSGSGYRHYDCVAPGFKYNMMDLQAALGLHQLARVDANLQRRERQWSRYDDALRDLPLTLPAVPAPTLRHARHLYTVRIEPDAPLSRDGLLQALHDERIGAGVHYRAIHEHSYYRARFGYRSEDLPVAHDIGARTLSLPLGPARTAQEQERVIEALHRRLAG